MSPRRQRDIEIYLLNCPVDRLLSWLEATLGQIVRTIRDGSLAVYRFQGASDEIPVVVMPDIEDGPWTCVWFNSSTTPWATDLTCARQAAQALGCDTRCSPDSPAAPGVFIQLSGGAEKRIYWDAPAA